MEESLKLIKTRIGASWNETSTMQFLVLPLFQKLGYDVFSPSVVAYEYKSSLRTDKSERCDMVILNKQRKPVIMIEIKSSNSNLDKYTGQIKAYFIAQDTAKYAILTNGDEYWIYDSSQKVALADAPPKYKLSIKTINVDDIDILNFLSSEHINSDIINSSHIGIEKDTYITSSNSIKSFINQIDLNKIIGASVDSIFEQYHNFCKSHRLERKSSMQLSRQIKENFLLQRHKTTINGISSTIYVNNEWIDEHNKTPSRTYVPSKGSVELFIESVDINSIRERPTFEVYNNYTHFCKNNKQKKESKTTFSRKLHKAFGIQTRVLQFNNKSCRFYV